MYLYPAQLSNIVYQLPYPNEVLHYVHIFPLPIKKICVLIPCPTLVILCTNLSYPNEVIHYVHISHLPLKEIVYLYPAELGNIVYQLTLPQRGTTLCKYFPPPIEPNLFLYPAQL